MAGILGTRKHISGRDDSEKAKYYALDAPLPLGCRVAIGHPEGYVASDILARYKKHAVSMCFTRWVGMHLDYLRNSMPSKLAHIHLSLPGRMSIISVGKSRVVVSRSTGIAKLTPPILFITNGLNGSSKTFSTRTRLCG